MSSAQTNKLPAQFQWGVSYAGHQVDGNDSQSDTSFLEKVKPSVFREASGVACDAWNRWESDLDLVQGLGLNAFRFSTEWARIEPEQGQIDQSALDHYDRLVDGCLERGIAPAVTLSHFTAPHWFAAQGGFLGPDSAAHFADFTSQVIKRLGDRISLVLTLNEPNLYMLLSWMGLPPFVAELERSTLDAASTQAGVERYRVGNVVLAEDRQALYEGFAAAHRAARTVIRDLCPSLPVGLSLSVTDDVAIGSQGAELVARKRQECYEVWQAVIAEDDFVGVQNYEQLIYGGQGLARPDSNSQPVNDNGTAVRPESLVNSVEYISQLTGLPIVVTEHGINTRNDELRTAFIDQSLSRLMDARSAGLPVAGYFHWTLMDNFEWISGYGSQLGLYSVDRTSLVRSPKPSAGRYAELVKAYRRQDAGGKAAEDGQ